jgi:hypothetical protein
MVGQEAARRAAGVVLEVTYAKVLMVNMSTDD